MAKRNRNANRATAVAQNASKPLLEEHVEKQRRLIGQAFSILNCALIAGATSEDKYQSLEPAIEAARDLMLSAHSGLDLVELERAANKTPTRLAA